MTTEVRAGEPRTGAFPAAVLDEIRTHGAEAYPYECCGALISVKGQIVEAF